MGAFTNAKSKTLLKIYDRNIAFVNKNRTVFKLKKSFIEGKDFACSVFFSTLISRAKI